MFFALFASVAEKVLVLILLFKSQITNRKSQIFSDLR